MRQAQDVCRHSIDEAELTTPNEQTKAVVKARDSLELLTRADAVNISGLIETVATGLFRHHPMNIDLEVSALALPGAWSHLTKIRRDSGKATHRSFGSFVILRAKQTYDQS